MKNICNWRENNLMSKITALVVVAMVCTDTAARPITREQARQQATQFMLQRGDARLLKAAVAAYPKHRRLSSPASTAADNQPYYVFDRGNQDGFVIVVGDDEMDENILGYCDSGSFNYDELPPNMREWLDGYAKEIEDYMAHKTHEANRANEANEAHKPHEPHRANTQKRIPVHPKVATLMTSKWSQASPYNDECPMYFTLGRSVTGCVATAYAQILYYHRSKMVTETQAAMPSYDTRTAHETYGALHVNGIPAGSPIDWDHMLDSYGSANDLQKKAVAQLMHYCGVAVQMDYTNGASSAYSSDVYDALRNYFGFGNSVQYVYGKSDEEWDQLIYNELANQRPVYISGADNPFEGHAFVCDGYDGDRRYHINWGWGGNSDGYYYLTNLTPGDQGIGGSGDGYTDGRECIIGIEPENYMERTMPFADANAKRLCTAAWDQNGDGVLSYGEAAVVTDLGTVLQGQSIRSLAELHYFIGLEVIADDAFSGCQQLTTVRLPRNVKHIGARAFKGCKKLTSVELPAPLATIGEEAFSGCTVLQLTELPAALKAVETGTFRDCQALAALTLPTGLTTIGNEAFSGCKGLKEMTITTLLPQNLKMGTNVFGDVPLEQAVLHIQQDTRAFFEADGQWSRFGTIKEHRTRTGTTFVPLTENQQVYLYHVGSGRFLGKGEAWGTQAVVTDDAPMRFQLRRMSTLPEGVYYLYSNDTGSNGHYTFRTNEDDNVGMGVKAAFVDGTTLEKRTYWKVTDVGNDTYTLSVPQGYDGYDAACRWGVQTDHASQYVQPTWGAYSDITYEGHEQDCQWRFVLYDADHNANYEAAAALENLITMAKGKHVSCQAEEEVLNNMTSTIEEMRQAQKTLREKMKMIDFADDIVRQTCVDRFDLDGDGEISYTEASKINSISTYFKGTAITSFDELQYFTSVTAIYDNAFAGCTKLTSVILPNSIERIYYYAFRGCTGLTSINLPEYVVTIGSMVFGNCTKLKTVRIDNPNPQSIDLKNDAFSGVSLKNCTLQVPVGSKELYAATPVWRNFGTIEEVRTATQPRTSSIYEGARGYVMNVATRKKITAGEAYGTQAVVGRGGDVYEWCRTSSMAEGQYYLKNVKTGKVIFRTSTDEKVGVGVKTCFADGNVAANVYWQVDSVTEGVYTLQAPKNAAGYKEGEYLGTDYGHDTGYIVDYTHALYWDIAYSGHEQQCQWVFISEDDMKAAKEADKNADQLKDLLLTAAKKDDIDATAEQAVYDNPLSSDEEIVSAITSLRRKLHYIDIDDARAKAICIENWDSDNDGELSLEEAAAVTDIGEIFRNQSQLKSLEVLRHFIGIQTIPDNAFRNTSSLTVACLPKQVTHIGEMAFTGTPLRFLIVENETAVVTAAAINGIRTQAAVFVPEALVETYRADNTWSKYAVSAYTGIPMVTPLPASRRYGYTTARLTYEVTGAPIDGEPELLCNVLKEAATPVGEYPIHAEPGTITTKDVVYQTGTFSITPAELTITAKSYTRKEGEENPVFEFTCKGFRNKETADVLETQPVITCEATKESPAGQYDIVISGATAHNYAITFVNGILTIEDTSGIGAPRMNNEQSTTNSDLYDMQGRRVVNATRRGLYIDRRMRRIVSR